MADGRDIAGGFGDGFALLLVLAPVLTFITIKRNGSVGERTAYNYFATFCNGAALVAYAAPVHNWPVIIINLVALIVEGIYTLIFYYYAEGRTRRITRWMVVSEIAWVIFLAIIYFGAFYGGRHEDARVMVFGILGAISAFCMYALLLVDTHTMWKTKDLTQISILLVLASLLNCVAWTIFATKSKPRDHYILVPNACGIGLTFGSAIIGLTVYVMGKLEDRMAARAREARKQAWMRRAIELPPVV